MKHDNFDFFWPNIKGNIAAIKDAELRNFAQGMINVLNMQRIGDGFVPIKAVSILKLLNSKTVYEFEETMRNQYKLATEPKQNEAIESLQGIS